MGLRRESFAIGPWAAQIQCRTQTRGPSPTPRFAVRPARPRLCRRAIRPATQRSFGHQTNLPLVYHPSLRTEIPEYNDAEQSGRAGDLPVDRALAAGLLDIAAQRVVLPLLERMGDRDDGMADAARRHPAASGRVLVRWPNRGACRTPRHRFALHPIHRQIGRPRKKKVRRHVCQPFRPIRSGRRR